MVNLLVAPIATFVAFFYVKLSSLLQTRYTVEEERFISPGKFHLSIPKRYL